MWWFCFEVQVFCHWKVFGKLRTLWNTSSLLWQKIEFENANMTYCNPLSPFTMLVLYFTTIDDIPWFLTIVIDGNAFCSPHHWLFFNIFYDVHFVTCKFLKKAVLFNRFKVLLVAHIRCFQFRVLTRFVYHYLTFVPDARRIAFGSYLKCN